MIGDIFTGKFHWKGMDEDRRMVVMLIIGLLPLMFASGVGANGNRSLGAGSVGGMLIGMILQLFVVPALFVAFQALQEKFKPIQWKDPDSSELDAEMQDLIK